MNLHEQIDHIGSLSPRAKTYLAIAVFVVLALLAGALVYIGYRWKERNHAIEITERDRRIVIAEADAARHLEGETQLAAQNSVLKKLNEAQAEAFTSADTARERQAANDLAKRNADLAARLDDIDADTQHDSILCGTCADFRASGFPLSAEFCNRCEVKK